MNKITKIPIMTSVGKYFLKMANNLVEINKLNRPFTVVVEGNIGSGKTTFLKYFNKFNNVCVFDEPIESWRNCKGHNFLNLMYKDPKKWSYTFQSYVQLTMLEQHINQTLEPVKLMERSIYSARYCFVEKLSRDGVLPRQTVVVLDEWFKWIIKTIDIPVDLIVYLRTSPEVVYKRMLERSRPEEDKIPLEYLQQLHEIYESWLYYKTLHHCPAPVVTIDANVDKSLMVEEYEKYGPHILNQIDLFARI